MIPKVSIIITAYRRLDFTKNLVHSILSHTEHPNYELIVVNSCPGYNKLLDDHISHLSNTIKVVSDSNKRQFTEAVEAGYNISDGEYIQILNDDMLIPKTQTNWLSSIQNFLMNNGECETCSLYQYLDGKRLYTIGETDINKPGHTCGRFRYTLDQLPKTKEVLWNNFSCVMISKNFINENRFLDVIPKEQYHYGSDSCYCRHVINKGKKNILINDAWVYHFNSRTIKTKVNQYVYNGI